MADDAAVVLRLPTGLPAEIEERIRAASGSMARDAHRRPRPLDRGASEAFLGALRAGLCVDDAAHVADRALSAFYVKRNREPEFAARWSEALEAGCAPIERALEATAFTAPVDSMARVRAAEVLLRTRHPRHQAQQQQGARVKVDGQTGQISVQVGTVGPD